MRHLQYSNRTVEALAWSPNRERYRGDGLGSFNSKGCNRPRVTVFLRDEVPEGHVAEFIDKMPQAHEAVQAAAAMGDGGVTQAIEALTSLLATAAPTLISSRVSYDSWA